MDTTTIILGITTSLLATIIVVIFRASIKVIISNLFGHVYPDVSGSYKLKFLEQNADEDLDTSIDITQFANRISGIVKQYKKGKLVSNDALKGVVTPTRVVKFQYESVSADHHEHGAMILKLSSDSRKMTGHVIFICETCENTGDDKVVLEKCERTGR